MPMPQRTEADERQALPSADTEEAVAAHWKPEAVTNALNAQLLHSAEPAQQHSNTWLGSESGQVLSSDRPGSLPLQRVQQVPTPEAGTEEAVAAQSLLKQRSIYGIFRASMHSFFNHIYTILSQLSNTATHS